MRVVTSVEDTGIVCSPRYQNDQRVRRCGQAEFVQAWGSMESLQLFPFGKISEYCSRRHASCTISSNVRCGQCICRTCVDAMSNNRSASLLKSMTYLCSKSKFTRHTTGSYSAYEDVSWGTASYPSPIPLDVLVGFLVDKSVDRTISTLRNALLGQEAVRLDGGVVLTSVEHGIFTASLEALVVVVEVSTLVAVVVALVAVIEALVAVVETLVAVIEVSLVAAIEATALLVVVVAALEGLLSVTDESRHVDGYVIWMESTSKERTTDLTFLYLVIRHLIAHCLAYAPCLKAMTLSSRLAWIACLQLAFLGEACHNLAFSGQ
ncbi:hypothetical protein KCU81_g3, partial [Aureobasidium melanogenum]